LCAQLTRDLLAIAKFLFVSPVHKMILNWTSFKWKSELVCNSNATVCNC